MREVKRLRDAQNHPAAAAKNPSEEIPHVPGPYSTALADALWTGRFSTVPALEIPAEIPEGEDRPRDAFASAATHVGVDWGERDSATAESTSSELKAQSERQYFRSVARLGVQAAEALDYAHGSGILHRDVKPSNLLLDARGTVWVTDFGLAKTEGADELTSPGDLVGTLRYMAPERFQGIADRRSDVYSLGLTLYELLTLTPAFAHSDRGRLMKQILEEDPPAPRALNRRIPRDLETIVLKAIDKEPSRRYSSAGQLAQDLQRYLEDRPLLARRATWIEHLRRWRRRNPAAATLTAMIAGLLLAAAVAAVSAAHYFRDLAEREEQARRKAENLAREIQDGLDRQNRAYRLLESAQDHVRRTQFHKAHADFHEAIRLRDDNPLAWSGRGLLFTLVYAWDAAASDLDRAFALHASREASEWCTHASLRLYCGDREGYRRVCKDMVKHFGVPDPRSCYYIVETCTLGPGSGVDPAEAVRLADVALHSDPKSQPYLSIMGRACYRAGEYERAIQFLNELNAQDDQWTNCEGWPVLAMAHHRVGRADEAQRWLEKTRRGLDEMALSIARDPFAYHFPARGRYNPLSVYLLYRETQQRMAPTAPDHPIRWAAQARGHVILGQSDQAVTYFAKAVAAHSENRSAAMAYWQFLARRGENREAANVLQAMLSRHPEEPWDWYCYALLRLDADDARAYREACEQMQQRFHKPQHFWPGQQLALICSLAPEPSTEEAWRRRLAEQALQTDPKNPWFVLTAALVHLRAGRFPDALALLDQAQECSWPEPYLQDSGTAIVGALHSLSCARLRRKEEARRWFDQAARRLDQVQPQERTGDQGPAWHTWLVCRILLRETAPLIGPRDGGLLLLEEAR